MFKVTHLSAILLLVVLTAAVATDAQTRDSTSRKRTIFRLKLTDSSGQLSKGYLGKMDDSVLFMVADPSLVRFNKVDPANYHPFRYQDIGVANLSSKSYIGKGVWIGATVGLVVGALIGFAEGSDPDTEWFGMSAEEKALTYGVFSAGVGCIVGGVIGALVHKKFTIHGSREKYLDMRHKLPAF
jgi:hypothetical protein